VWAMLGSDQRPLPCEGGGTGCWGFLELAQSLQMADFLCQLFSWHFQLFTRVAAGLLHRRYGLHMGKVRTESDSYSCLEPPCASLVTD
jgi:hypothetical protein